MIQRFPRNDDLAQLDTDGAVLAVGFDEVEDLGHREQANDGDEKINPVHQVQLAEGKARHAGGLVQPDHCDAKADTGRHRRFGLVVGADTAERAEGQQVQREILGRAKLKGDTRQHGGQQHQPDGGEEGADEGRNTRDHKGLARAALLGHRVAIQRGHHRRLVARYVQQDGRDPPAIHRAVIDRRQQDQCGNRIEPHRE